MARITGGKSYADRLRRLTGPEAQRQIGAALQAAGELIQTDAQISITAGAVSGKAHVPSAPGTPPNNDTGRLAGNIETGKYVAENGRVTVQVSSNAPYAIPQEFGNSKLPERPYMRPSAAKNREAASQLVARAVSHIAKGGTVTGD